MWALASSSGSDSAEVWSDVRAKPPQKWVGTWSPQSDWWILTLEPHFRSRLLMYLRICPSRGYMEIWFSISGQTFRQCEGNNAFAQRKKPLDIITNFSFRSVCLKASVFSTMPTNMTHSPWRVMTCAISVPISYIAPSADRRAYMALRPTNHIPSWL